MKYYLIFIILFTPILMYSEQSDSGFTFRIGGNLGYQLRISNDYSTPLKDKRTEFIGGGFNLEAGHIYLRERNKLIHGTDSRIGFSVNIDSLLSSPSLSISETEKSKTNCVLSEVIKFSVGTTYIIGRETATYRYLFDIVGAEFGVILFKEYTKPSLFDSGDTRKLYMQGTAALIGVNLPLGFQYIHKNGFSIGYRHRIDFALNYSQGGAYSFPFTPNFGPEYGQENFINYNFVVSIGYTYGFQ